MNKNKLYKIHYGLCTHYVFLVPYIVIRLIGLLPFGIAKIAWREVIFPIFKCLTPKGIKEGHRYASEMYEYYKYRCEHEKGE